MIESDLLKTKNKFLFGEESLALWLEIIHKKGSLIKSFCSNNVHTPFTHYPLNDFTSENGLIQYYYHSHRPSGEHGHIHVFIKESISSKLTHFIAIGLTSKGLPISLFTVNPSTVDESTFTPSKTILDIANKIILSNKADSPLSRWLISFLLFYEEKIENLLAEREKASLHQSASISNEILSILAIDWERDLQESEEINKSTMA